MDRMIRVQVESVGRTVVPGPKVRVTGEPAPVPVPGQAAPRKPPARPAPAVPTAPPSHHPDPPPGEGHSGEPRIELVREGEVIQAIEVICTCGQRIRLRCSYDEE
jgi:hypothetical protein